MNMVNLKAPSPLFSLIHTHTHTHTHSLHPSLPLSLLFLFSQSNNFISHFPSLYSPLTMVIYKIKQGKLLKN